MPPFCLLSPCFLFNYAMSITRLAVNWFNYPICLWQAWFQPNCSSCGRRWQTIMWRRRTACPITVTGVWTCRPPPPFPPKTTTSMDPPTASTSATHSRERRRGDTCEIIYIQLYRVLGIIEDHCPCWRWKSLQGKPDWWTGTHRAFPAYEY